MVSSVYAVILARVAAGLTRGSPSGAAPLTAQRSLRLAPGGPGRRILCGRVLSGLRSLHVDGHVVGGDLTVFVRHRVLDMIRPRVVGVRGIEDHLRRDLERPGILQSYWW